MEAGVAVAVEGGGAEGLFGDARALEKEADVELVGDTNAAVHLHGLVGGVQEGVAEAGFGSGAVKESPAGTLPQPLRRAWPVERIVAACGEPRLLHKLSGLCAAELEQGPRVVEEPRRTEGEDDRLLGVERGDGVSGPAGGI